MTSSQFLYCFECIKQKRLAAAATCPRHSVIWWRSSGRSLGHHLCLCVRIALPCQSTKHQATCFLARQLSCSSRGNQTPGTATAQPCVSPLAASTPASTTVRICRKSVHAPQSAPMRHECLCAHPGAAWHREVSPSPGLLSAPSWVCFNGSSETLPQCNELMNVTYHSISSTISHSVTMATASLAQFLRLLRSA